MGNKNIPCFKTCMQNQNDLFNTDLSKIQPYPQNELNTDDVVNIPKDKNVTNDQNSSNKSRQIFFDKLIKESKLIHTKNGIETYLYPQRKLNNLENAAAKTLIVLGQTGSGKTTLLNSFLNYLLDVEINDPFRFVLIHENYGKSQSESLTSAVTLYQIKGTRNCPPLNIIDTPGFGDTRGLKQDQLIIDMIRDVFSKQIDVLHVVCFVAQSSLARLTVNQKYIFARIMEIFGKDIAENFVAMLTFCDGGEPNILEALTDKNGSSFAKIIPKIKNPWYLKFNNSAIFSAKNNDKMREIFWNIAMEGFKEFVAKKLMKNSNKSLRMTKEVLSERKKLEDTLNCLRPQLDLTLAMKESIRKNILIVEQNKDQMKASKNFEITSTIQKPQKKPLDPGIHTTHCRNCNRTCHNNCAFADDKDKANCCAMDQKGYCKACPKKCYWEIHSNVPYIIEYVKTTEKTTSQELYEKYRTAKSTKKYTEEIVDGLTTEFMQISLRSLQLQKEIKKIIDKLMSIALKKNMSESTIEYIDLNIQSEKDEKKPGYLERIQGLNDMKKHYQLLEEICQNDTTSDMSLILNEAESFMNGSDKNYSEPKYDKLHRFLSGLKNF